jgi:hypothetical protein
MKTILKILFIGLITAVSACRNASYSGEDVSCKDASDPACKASTTSELLAPSNIDATVISESKIKVTWTVPNYSKDFSVVLEMKVKDQASFAEVKKLDQNADSFEVDSLDSNTTYVFRMKSTTDSKESDYSDEVEQKTSAQVINPLYPIPSMTVSLFTPGVVEIHRTWSNTSTGYVSTAVWERKREAETTWTAFGASGYSYHILDGAPLDGSVMYRVRVQYVDLSTYTSAPSNTITAILSPPTNFAATAVTLINGSHSHNFTWSYGVSAAAQDGYSLEWGYANGTMGSHVIAGAATRTDTFIAPGCTTGSTVSYWLKATSNNALVISSIFTPIVTMTCP